MTRECDGCGRFSVVREIFLEANIELIDRFTRRVCRRCGVAAG